MQSLAGALDTITHARVYKTAMPLEFALEVLEECAGTQLGPALVEIACRALFK